MAFEDYFRGPAPAGSTARPMNWNKSGKNVLLATFIGAGIEAVMRHNGCEVGLQQLAEDPHNIALTFLLMGDALWKGGGAYIAINLGINYINQGRIALCDWLKRD